MAFGKWMSLGAGTVGAVVAAALLLYFSIVHAAGATLGPPMIIVTSLCIGCALALVHWIIFSHFGQELRRVIAHAESLVHVEAPQPLRDNYRPKMGLTAFVEAVDHSVGALRRRVDKMTAQRRELEVQVRISETECRNGEAILDSISDAVVVTDAFNELVQANRAAQRMFDFELDRCRRAPIDKILSDAALVKLIKDTRESEPNQPVRRRQVEYEITRQGTRHVYQVTLTCLTNNSQAKAETDGVVTILRDITRDKTISEMKSDFVSNVSHELRTPLSSIKAYMEMLIDGEARDEQTRVEFYGIIQGEANRLSRLIDNILNISRIESGVVKVQREHVSLYSLIKEAVDVMKPQSRAKEIDLTFTSPPLLIQVFADKDMIYQAVMNLISNAIKYTPPQGSVTVTIDVDQRQKTACVSVADTGVGVPAEDLPHLFEKFYRVKDHKNLAKGTGLGLNLVKHIIETVHGGEIQVTSRPEAGSTFTFTLPLADLGC